MIFPLSFYIFVVVGISAKENVRNFIAEIITGNLHRSAVLVYNDLALFGQFSSEFYELADPFYNIFLPGLPGFNGKYHEAFFIEVTYEESLIYFIFLNRIEEVYEALALTRKIYLWRDRHRTIILVNGEATVDLPAVFKHFYQHNVLNVVIAFLAGEGVKSFTFHPFRGGLTESQPPDFFLDKFDDLYGYTLKISMFPSVVNVDVNGVFQGADGVVSRIISKHLNATFVYFPPRVTKYAPVINQYDDVAERIVDVGFNTRYVKFNFRNSIEKTYPHDRDDLSVLVPKAKLEATKGLLSLLPPDVWIMIFVLSIIYFMFLTGAVFLDNHDFNPLRFLLTVLLILLNKPTTETFKSTVQKFTFTSFSVFCFFINTILMCRLTSVITAPDQTRDIETVRELSKTGYKIVTIDRFQELLNSSLSPKYKEDFLSRLILIDEEEYLAKIAKCDNVIFICKDHLAKYAVIQNENYPNGVQFYHLMKEKILPTLSCYIVCYGSPILPRLNTLVGRLLESGVYDYWKTRIWKHLSIVAESKRKHGFDNGRRNVSFSELWMSIYVLFIGNAIAVSVFVIEFLSKLRRNEKPTSAFVHRKRL